MYTNFSDKNTTGNASKKGLVFTPLDNTAGNQNFVSFLKESFGLNDEQIMRIMLFLQPMLNEYIEKKVLDTFSDYEITAIDQVAKEEGFNDAQKSLMFAEGYEEKNNRSLGKEVEVFFDSLVGELKKAVDDSDIVVERISTLAEEKREEEAQKLIDGIISKQVNI